MALDYVGSFKAARGTDALHYGVKGMKWGVRNQKLSGSVAKKGIPTRARVKEEKNIAGAKEVVRLTNLRERVQAGKATVTVNGKRLSTEQATRKIDKQIAAKSKNNPIAAKNKVGPDSDSPKGNLKKDVDSTTGESSVARYNRLKAEVAKKGANSLEDGDLKFLNTRREALSKANAAYNTKDSKLQKLVKAAIEATLTKQLNTSVEQLSQLHVAPRLARAVNRTNRNPPTPTPTPTP